MISTHFNKNTRCMYREEKSANTRFHNNWIEHADFPILRGLTGNAVPFHAWFPWCSRTSPYQGISSINMRTLPVPRNSILCPTSSFSHVGYVQFRRLSSKHWAKYRGFMHVTELDTTTIISTGNRPFCDVLGGTQSSCHWSDLKQQNSVNTLRHGHVRLA
jgi:hypothetical protein